MHRLKIVHIYPYFLTVKGGVERHLEGLVSYQVKFGQKVTIYTKEKPVCINNFNGAVVRQFGSIHHALLNINFSKEIDIVHVHGLRDSTLFTDAMEEIAKMKGKRIVLTAHGIYPNRSVRDYIIKKTYDATAGRLKLHNADAIIALSAHNKYQLLQVGVQASKLYIVPNSISLERFQKLPPSKLFIQEFHLENKEILLYVGRIDWNKGLEYAIAAMHILKKKMNKQAVLAIVGKDFGYQQYFNTLVHKHNLDDSVLFTGEVNENTLLSAYNASSVLLLPSVYEGLPTVVLEALACGLPTIATRTGGTGHILDQGVTGMLVDYGNAQQLASTILELISNDQLQSTIVSNGKTLVKNKFDWAKNVKEIQKIYESALNLKT